MILPTLALFLAALLPPAVVCALVALRRGRRPALPGRDSFVDYLRRYSGRRTPASLTSAMRGMDSRRDTDLDLPAVAVGAEASYDSAITGDAWVDGVGRPSASRSPALAEAPRAVLEAARGGPFPGFRAVSGEEACDYCGLPHHRHPLAEEWPDWDGEAWLTRLCGGALVRVVEAGGFKWAG